MAEPTTLTIGVDAGAAAMIEAAGLAFRSKMPNALFAVSAAEALPGRPLWLLQAVRLAM